MFSSNKFKEYEKKSMENEYFLTNVEKRKMIKYIDFYNKTHPNPCKGGGLLQLVAFGPSCWSGGGYHIKFKHEGGKKCWFCNYYHC